MSPHNTTELEHSITTPTPVTGTPKATTQIEDLLALMASLRADCPWDIKQTNHSLIPYAIEEAYELAEAIQEGDIEDIKGELGDVLLQVIFHCQIYAEQQQFDLGDVIYTLQSKLIRRHPHVFEADKLPDEAQSLQKSASKLGFDWEGVAGAVEKLEEEIAELKQILPQEGERVDAAHKKELEKELGDCVFGLVNVARKLNLDAEAATLTCVHKFRHGLGLLSLN